MFLVAHATHPDWRMALSFLLAQAQGQAPDGLRPTLGFLYLTDHHAAHAEALLAGLRDHYPGTQWVGTVGVGVAASGVEYFDEPGLVMMLTDLPPSQFRLFSGREPLGSLLQGPGFRAATALVHAEPRTPDLGELISELAGLTRDGVVFGGLTASRGRSVHLADAVLEGGLSGVAFGAEVPVLARVTQGCSPIAGVHRVTDAEGQVVRGLDGRPALEVLREDLSVGDGDLRAAVPRLQGTLAALQPPPGAGGARRPGIFDEDTRMRHLIGVDPRAGTIALADTVEAGDRLTFCRRDREAARRDLVRICTEVRAQLEDPQDEDGGAPPSGGSPIRGAIYVSCSGRGGPHFGAPSAELQIVRHALGDVPLAGFFAAGEIGHRQVHGYTGVLFVFAAP
jgi:small ligand-binding sensory domain FIST